MGRIAQVVALAGAALSFVLAGPALALDGKPGTHGGTVYYAYTTEGGEPLYPADFKHWNYVNPNAPKGGEFRSAGIGTFDNLNPYNGKGRAAGAITAEALMTTNADELSMHYGWLAEWMEVPADASWVIFKLRNEAKWWDGTPITADDVIFTLDKLKKDGSQQLKQYFHDLARAEKVSEKEVRIVFEPQGEVNKELPYITGQLPVLSKAVWEKRDFTATTLEPWMSSGAYRPKSINAPNGYVLERVPNYWGANMPFAVGMNNFDTMRVDFYADLQVALEAFKAGEYDFRSENSALRWATGYDGPALQRGLIVRATPVNNNPTYMQGLFINTRKAKFQNRKVREALQYVFDFEWSNNTLFFGQYRRLRSFWENQEYAATGTPTGKELAILEPFRAQLPPELFTTEYNPPKTDGTGNNRASLMRAQQLFAEGGYTVRNGALVNQAGEQMVIEFLLDAPDQERIIAPIVQNLERLGVKASLRTVDSSQYVQRMNTYDYDITVYIQAQSTYPGNEQREMWSCASAKEEAADNVAGICSPVIDALIDKIIYAPDKETLIATTKALDRVLQWGFYVVPEFTAGTYRIAYWDKFGQPEKSAKYSVGVGWWYDPEKARRVDAAKATIR